MALPRCFFDHLSKMIEAWDLPCCHVHRSPQKSVFLKLQSSFPLDWFTVQIVPRLPSYSRTILQGALPTADTSLTLLGWPVLGSLISATTDILSIVSCWGGISKISCSGHQQPMCSWCCTEQRAVVEDTQCRQQREAEENYFSLDGGFAQGKFTYVFPCKVAQ